MDESRKVKRVKQVRLLIDSTMSRLQTNINETLVRLYTKYDSIDDVDVQITGVEYQVAARIQYSIEVSVKPKKQENDEQHYDQDGLDDLVLSEDSPEGFRAV